MECSKLESGLLAVHLALEVKNLDHLSLASGVIDEIDLVNLTNEVIEPHSLSQVNAGQVVKATILNPLGFLSTPLYLFSESFESKAVSHLLGEEAEAHP